jgi:hypothetical protein
MHVLQGRSICSTIVRRGVGPPLLTSLAQVLMRSSVNQMSFSHRLFTYKPNSVSSRCHGWTECLHQKGHASLLATPKDDDISRSTNTIQLQRLVVAGPCRGALQLDRCGRASNQRRRV